MKSIGSREFQLTYQRLEKPVRVVAKSGSKISRVIGHFYPGEHEPVEEKHYDLERKPKEG